MTLHKTTLFALFIFCILSLNAGDIHEAVKSNDFDRVKQLISDNPDLIHSLDEFKRTPLHYHFLLSGWSESKVVVRFWIIAAILLLATLSTLKLR